MDQISQFSKQLYSPNIQLLGHNSELFSGKFSKDGELFATGGFDKTINIWETFGKNCDNITYLNGHSNAILDLCWGKDNTRLFSCGADKTISIWDIFESKRLKKYKEHDSFINGIDSLDNDIIVSVGEDCALIINDLRQKEKIHEEKFRYQLTCTKFNTSNDDEVFIGGIDNQIKVFNRKMNKVDNILIGHVDTITGLAVSHNGNMLLSNSADNTLKVWDIRPFAKGGRLLKTLKGVVHNFEKNLLRCAWSKDDKYVSAGSADRIVHIWSIEEEKIVSKFTGHTGSINEVDFNIQRNIISSVSSDFTAIIGVY